MTKSIYDTDDTLAEMVHDVTLGELLQLKRENPDAADWYDDLILAKKDQMGIADLGTTWGVQITANTDKEVADLDPNNWSQMEKENPTVFPLIGASRRMTNSTVFPLTVITVIRKMGTRLAR